MAQAINAPLNVQVQNGRQLTQQVQASLNAVRLNLGNGKALSSLSQPLGRLTGQADEFTKSLDAANARVLAFGASVGIVNAFSNAFKGLVNSTIEVEKAIKAITVVGDQFNGKTKQLTQGLFNVAKVTGQSFAEVSKAALEFSRQGQGVEETLRRTQDALTLTRLTGLDAAKAVEGLTAAANGFAKAGLNTTQILNKLAAVDQAFAVSSADLIEGFNRSAAVAENAGVTFDELSGIITALQQKTSRGGAVIGNALKTIFTRLQDTSTLNQLQNLGVAVQDLQGNLLPARQILQNLAGDVEGLGQITKAGIFKDVAGAFQINQLISLVSDLNDQNSIAAAATKKSAGATNEAFIANEKLNQSLEAIINKVALTGKQLGSLIGEIGLSDSFKSILDGINGFLEGATNLLQGDDLGSKFAKGIVKGIGAVLTGPGLGIFLAVIGKLTLDLVKFGSQSIKAFFGIGQAAKQQQQIQESIVQTLLRNENVLRTILNTQGGQNAQAQAFLGILNQQEKALQSIRSLAGGIAAPVIAAGYGVGSEGGIQRRGRAAGGYLPAQEASDVRRGVGGALPNSKVVSIPNFAFGGGKRGTMIANTSEYIVPNYAGGGSAIFNQDMVKTMGLPAGAKKIGAASGYVPNFANFNVQTRKKRKEKDANIINDIKIGGMSPSAYLTLGSGARTNAGKFRDLQTTAQEILQQRLGPISQSAKIEGSGIEFINLNRLQSTYLSGGELVSDITDLRLNINSGQVNKSDLGQRLRNIANKILPQTPGKLDDGLREQLESEIFSTSQAKFSAGNIFEQVLVKTVSGQLAEKNSKTWDLPKNMSAAFKKRFGIGSEFGDIKLGISPSSVSSFIGKHIINPTGDNKSSASNGYIPNFADSNFTNDQLGVLGLYGSNEPINGSPVYTFESNRPEFYKDIKSGYQKRITGFVNSYSKQIASKIGGGFQVSPKAVIKSLDSTDRISGFIFEDVMNQLAGPNFDTNRVSGNVRIDFPMTSNLREVFGVTGAQRFAEVKLTPQEQISSVIEKQQALARALATGGYTPKETDSKLIEELRKEAIEVEFGKGGRPKIELKDRKKAFIQKMRSSGLLTQTYLGQGADETNAIKKVLGLASTGYIPNFAASALQEAIAREKNAGLSSSQIYVDQSSALKSALNPMGLMVANTRDEPSGGFQGIARARREGSNPKTYGASKGFIPNYAPSSLSGGATSGVPGLGPVSTGGGNTQTQSQNNTQQTQQTKQTKSIQDSIGSLISLQIASTALTGILSEAGETAQKFGSALGGALLNIQSIKELGKTEGGVSFGEFGKNFSRARKEIRQGTARSLLGAGGGFTSANFGKGLGLVTKGFLRFAPLIGQVVLGFDILNGVLKAFGFDVVKYFTDSFRGVNDAGQKAKDSIENFAEILNQEGGKISGEKTSELFKERLNKLIEDQKIESSGLPAATEEQRKAATVKLLNEEAKATYRTLTGKSITESISKAGISPTVYGGRVRSTRNVQALDETTVASLEASFIEAFAPFQNLADEDVQALAKNKGIVGENISELRKSVLKSVIDDLNNTRDTIVKGSVQNGKLTKDASQLTAEFRRFATRGLYKNYLNALKATEEDRKVFENRLQQNVEAVLQGEQQLFNRINRELSNAVDLFSSATSTKTFSSLGIGEQTNFLNALDIGKSQQNFIKGLTDFRSQAADTLLGQFRERGLTSGLTKEQGTQIENFILNFDPSNIKAFNEELNNFVTRLGGVNKEGFNKLQETANGLSEQQADLISKRGSEIKLLQFSINERNSETKAIQYFNKEVVKFGSSIVAAEKEIQNLNSQIKILDLQSDFDTSISDAFALSSDEALSKRQGIELKTAQDKARIEAQINEKQARIDLQRTLFTKENTIALNRNTEMLKELLNVQSIAMEDSLKQEKDKLANEFRALTGGSDINDLLSGLSPEASNLQQQYNRISNVLRAMQNRATSSATTVGAGGINTQGGIGTKFFPSVDELIAGYEADLTTGKSPEDAIQSYVAGLGYSEEASLIVRDALLEYSRTLDKNVNAAGNLQNELQRAQGLERDKNDLLSTYAATLRAQVKQGQDALRNPSTVGEFVAQQNANKLAKEALSISERGIENPEQLFRQNPQEYRRLTEQNNPAVREFLSSGSYGFSEGLSQIEKQTLDFRREIGQEVPRLFSQNLAQGLNDAISGAKSLKDALRDAATSFLNAITQKNVENIANLVTGGVGNVAQSFFASGGQVNGGSGVKDDVPAMLMGGEYVIRKSAVKKYGSKFLDSLNNGGIKAFAKGGGVQSGRGGFYVPGDYGEGAITGKGQLLAFAGQSFTGGQYDQVGVSGMSGASINLESESARLTAFGRENSPMFERIQQAKEEAFNVYLNQLKQEEQYREQLKQIEEAEKARKKQLTTAIVSAVASSVLSYGATKLGQRFNTGKLNAQVDALNYGPQTSANLSSIGNSAGLRNMVAGAPLTSAAQTYSQGVQTNFTEPMLPVAGVGPNPLLPALNRNFPVDLAGQTPDGFFNPYPKPGRANGGPILGGSGVRDDVPAMLTGGEFVLNNRATRKLGVENLNRLNSGDVGGNSGQQVSEAVVSKLDELIKTTRESSKNNVVVNVSGMEGGMENKEKRADENKSNTEKELQRKIRDAVLAVLAQEKRLGGSLSK